MRMGAIVASGGVAPAPMPVQPLLVPPPAPLPPPIPAMAPAPAAPPLQNPFPPLQVRCTSSTDYMGQVHAICQ